MAITRTTRRVSAQANYRAARVLVAVTVPLALVSVPVRAEPPQNPPSPEATAQSERAGGWQITPSIALLSTLTDNVNLQPSSDRKSDWVNEITPALSFSGTSAHSNIAGAISLPVLVYARTTANDYVAPQASVKGSLEAIEKFLYVDGSVNVSQEYANPFGPTPSNLASATRNRYTAQTYTVSPYIKGVPRDGLDYELRQKSTWTNATGIAGGSVPGINGEKSFTSDVSAHVAQAARPGGWRVDYDRSDLRFYGEGVVPGLDQETLQTASGSLSYRPDPTVQVTATGGYEDDDFFATHESGAIYGGGVEWHPDARTSLVAHAQHHFFGTGYNVSFEHRTLHTVWSLKASRDLTSYPEQVATLPAGSDVAALLNALFTSRVADPAQRQALVEQLMAERNLPQSLASPVVLYAQQITLAELATATFGILGARNSVFLNAYHSRNEPVPGTPSDILPLLSSALLNNTQDGVNLIWTHNLAANLAAGLTGGWSRTTENGGQFDTGTGRGRTTLYTVDATLTQSLSRLTSVLAGMRYQDSTSDIARSYQEFAVYLGITHRFR